ncbi:alpha/beta fold hydrolase [Sedimentitalea sp. JM2-8]|uniref:Alpha/beta fold hydrolase n=1 Tax=Sedimentitalea xiamensis TaxID=3050037 RepID=A0ABT7FJX4_9RHOB|nr:alpha/beta fold hydrolase [Sedimentitalea xiamensis]MDK3075290.1 alpha/beta fold hydrolase [Sedimentitalea xiamensis]
MTAEDIIALVASLIAGEPDPSHFPNLTDGSADPAYVTEITPCARPVAPAEIEGETVICGTVTVPEDHDAPEGRQMNLSWIVYKAHSLSPAPDPVVYLHGGPGGGTVRNVHAVSQFFDHLRQRRDIVSFDQRGVDASAPDMDCFGTIADNLDESVRSFAGEELPDLPVDFTRSCLEEIVGRGVDIKKINTTQNARDVGAVMSALGYPAYNIYGVSYGTKLTLEVMRQELPGIRSIVLDGVAPPQVNLYDSLITPYAESFDNTFGPCERDPVCAEAYPGITARFYALLDSMMEEPVEVMGQPYPGIRLFLDIKGRNDRRSQNPNKISTYLPLMVAQLEEGDTTLLTQMVSGQIPPQVAADSLVAQASAAGLSGDEQALVVAATTAAQVIEANTAMAQQAIRQLESDIAADRANVGLAELFDDIMDEAIRALPSRDDRLAVGRDYLNLRFAEPEKTALLDLVTTHFSGSTASQLAALTLSMDDADVARVFELIGLDNQALEDGVEGDFESYLFACQEDFVDGFNSLEGVKAETESLPFGPLMTQLLINEVPTFFDVCEQVFTPVPRDNWLEPVKSDQRVLVMNGEIDTQTSGAWGAVAAETLINAQNLVFPESGHGTILFSQCARDITEAFIENPEGTIDTSCIADLRPPVMLPDGNLHPLPL